MQESIAASIIQNWWRTIQVTRPTWIKFYKITKELNRSWRKRVAILEEENRLLRLQVQHQDKMSWSISSTKFEPKVDAFFLHEYYRTKPDPPYKLYDVVIGRQGVMMDGVLKQIKLFDKENLFISTISESPIPNQQNPYPYVHAGNDRKGHFEEYWPDEY